MLKLAELIGYDLRWVRRVALTMEYELRAGEMLAAALHIRGFLRSFATAESADGGWTFEQHGFWKHTVTIRISGTETDLAVFKTPDFVVGTLELTEGRQYYYQKNNRQSAFELETGEALISYRNIGGILYRESQVEIHPLAKDVPEMPWMVPLGWHLIMLEDKYAGDLDIKP